MTSEILPVGVLPQLLLLPLSIAVSMETSCGAEGWRSWEVRGGKRVSSGDRALQEERERGSKGGREGEREGGRERGRGGGREGEREGGKERGKEGGKEGGRGREGGKLSVKVVNGHTVLRVYNWYCIVPNLLATSHFPGKFLKLPLKIGTKLYGWPTRHFPTKFAIHGTSSTPPTPSLNCCTLNRPLQSIVPCTTGC